MSDAATPTPEVSPEATPASATVDRSARSIHMVGRVTQIAAIVLFVAGVFTWFFVKSALQEEKITVADDAPYLAGEPVDGPFTAYAQTEIIQKHSLEATGGKTYAELPRDDPSRAIVQDASYLRASLFTSVVSFGVAAMAAGLGVVLFLIGMALVSTSKGLRAV